MHTMHSSTNMMVTALLRANVRRSKVFLLSTRGTSRLGERIQDDAVGDQDSQGLGNRGTRNQRVGDRHAQRQNALEQEGTDQHMADLAAGSGCAADQNGGSGHEAHLTGSGVQLHEAVALGVNQNAHSTQNGGQSGADDAHLVNIDAGENYQKEVIYWCQEALEQAQLSKNPSGEQWVLAMLGSQYKRHGNLDKALKLYQQSKEKSQLRNKNRA